MKYLKITLLLIVPFLGCKKDEPSPPGFGESMYFPSNTDTVWERKSIADLGWNATVVQPLKDYLIQKNTKSFMILVNGRIVMEEYFNGHTQNAPWQWNSAGKTLTTVVTGIAQQEGLININNKVSQYLGTGWTTEPLAKENLITPWHLLTMTSGIKDSTDLITTATLRYLADAGTSVSNP